MDKHFFGFYSSMIEYMDTANIQERLKVKTKIKISFDTQTDCYVLEIV